MSSIFVLWFGQIFRSIFEGLEGKKSLINFFKKRETMYNSELIFKQVCYGSSRERVSNFSYLIFLVDYIHLKHIFCNIVFLHFFKRINYEGTRNLYAILSQAIQIFSFGLEDPSLLNDFKK